MEDNTQDVLNALNSSTSGTNAEGITIDTDGTNTSVAQEVTQPEQTVEETSTPLAPEASETIQSEVDEMGVPYKNRYMESQRKLDKALEKLDSLDKRFSESQGQPKQQYTIGQLRAFAQATDDPNHAQWAWDEVHKIEKREQAELIRQEIGNFQKRKEVEEMKAQTFNAVISRNPEIAIKDTAGNFVGWNTKSPLLQRMNQYMANPRIAQQPDALEVAEAFAIRDLSRMNAPQVTQKIVKQNNQIKNLQKGTLVEGTGSRVEGTVTPRQVAVDKAKSGTMKDATMAMSEILKATGIIKE